MLITSHHCFQIWKLSSSKLNLSCFRSFSKSFVLKLIFSFKFSFRRNRKSDPMLAHAVLLMKVEMDELLININDSERKRLNVAEIS